MIFRRVFFFCIFVFLLQKPLFSYELNCPFGCSTQETDPNISEIGLKFHRCVKKVGFEEGNFCGGKGFNEEDDVPLPDFLMREEEEYLFGRKDYYETGFISWENNLDSEIVIFGEEDDDELLKFCFEHQRIDYLSGEIKKKNYFFESYSQSYDAFLQLQSDVNFYSDAEIAFLKSKILDKKKEIRALKNRYYIGLDDPYFGISSSDLKSIFEQNIVNYETEVEKLKQYRFENLQVIERCESEIDIIYDRILTDCLVNHKNSRALFERGLLKFHEGDFFNSLCDVKEFISQKQLEGKIKELESEIFLLGGQIESELGLYQDAIVTLCSAIEKNPSNLEAYIERANAYFETGCFDKSLSDYLKIRELVDFSAVKGLPLIAFSKGLCIGAAEGFGVAAVDFFPSLLTTASGMGHLLWAGICDPQKVPQKLSKSAYDLFDYLSKTDLQQICAMIELEVLDLLSDWNRLDQQQKGEKTGRVIGKFGLDVLTGTVIAKGIYSLKTYQDLKKANQLFTLECISQQNAASQSLLNKSGQIRDFHAEAIQKFKTDEAFLKTFKGKSLDEITVRRILHQAGRPTFKRPEGLPQTFKVHFTDKGCGMMYCDPKNPDFHNIRIMPGKPHSPNPAQQGTYVKYVRDGQYRDKHNNIVSKDAPEAHIPLDDFVFSNLEQK